MNSEQADHARGAGRKRLVKEFESFAPWIIQHADICPGEDLCECGKRERVQKWREALQKLREPGADTGNLWKRADEVIVKLTAHCAGVDLPDEGEHRKAVGIIMDALEGK